MLIVFYWQPVTGPKKNDQQNYFFSPWPAQELRRRVPVGKKVAIIGTSLSAIETLLTLSSEGEFIRDIIISLLIVL